MPRRINGAHGSGGEPPGTERRPGKKGGRRRADYSTRNNPARVVPLAPPGASRAEKDDARKGSETEPGSEPNRRGHLPAKESGPGASDGRAILEAVAFTRCHGGR